MDTAGNPYRPGAGTRPVVLAGRDAILGKADALLQSVNWGAPQRSLMLYGLRGVGKTVLLNEIEDSAARHGYLVDHLEMSESDEFRRVIAKSARKILLQLSTRENLKDKASRALGVLKSFSIKLPDGPELRLDVEAAVGIADSGDLDSDTVDLMLALGEAAQEAGVSVCFLLDEVQYLDEKALSGLIAANHRVTQKAYPVAFICAGLPQVTALAGEARSYAERLFEFVEVGPLGDGDAVEALVGPARSLGVSFEPGAVDAILEATEGYPYFLQEYGKHTWAAADSTPISRSDALAGCAAALSTLDASFFKVRVDRATRSEKEFFKAMACIGVGPYKMGDVARKRGVMVTSLGPTRASLIRKGFVFSPGHGYIDFTVPQFDRFVRRHYGV